MPGKLIIHGINQSFIVGGTINIFHYGEKVGFVEKKGTAEFVFEDTASLVLTFLGKSENNPRDGHIEIQNGMQTEVQCIYDRKTYELHTQIISTTPYQGTGEDLGRMKSVERPVYVLDGGLKSILYVYEDHVVISHHGVANAIQMGVKGDKTIYYSDITSVQYKEPGSLTGYIQFSIPGGNESKGGVFASMEDENTVTLKNKPNIIKEAIEIVDFLNKKIREAKTGARTAQTVIQQTSAADELKKFKELLDGGVITQEEFDAKKKQLLGL